MSACDEERLERAAAGMLSPNERVELEAHLRTCAACAKELRWLAAERKLVHARGDRDEPLPEFEALELAQTATVPSPPWRWRGFAVAAAAVAGIAIAVGVLSRRGERPPVAASESTAMCLPPVLVGPRTLNRPPTPAGFSRNRGPAQVDATGPRPVGDLCL
ncbi:MAG: zf-HC2 domain-containing protein [Deltaproteobacteria bacterium]|nr:zf-HC2 domain-containing protein [Deltaproteobacteria bacterium]